MIPPPQSGCPSPPRPVRLYSGVSSPFAALQENSMRPKLIAAVVVLAALGAVAWFGYSRLRPSPPATTEEVSALDAGDGVMTVARLGDKRPAVRRKALEALGPSRDA